MTSENAIRDYAWLVKVVARDMIRSGLDLEDLMQEGYIGLMQAAGEWTEESGVAFATRARSRIQNAIRDYERHISFDYRIGDLSLDSTPIEGEVASLHDVFGTPPTQDEDVESHEKIDAVREGLRVLSPADRELLRFWTECHTEGGHRQGAGAIPEMARRAGTSRETMRDRVRGARKRLEREVAPFVDETADRRVAS